MSQNGTRILITVVSAALGTCFGALAGLSIWAIAFPARRIHFSSGVIALAASCLAWFAFRMALGGDHDEDTLPASVWHGIIAGFLSLIIAIAFLVLFGGETRSFVAHAFSKPASSMTTTRLLVAAVLLGFGAGFVLPVAGVARGKPAEGQRTAAGRQI